MRKKFKTITINLGNDDNPIYVEVYDLGVYETEPIKTYNEDFNAVQDLINQPILN